MPPTTRGMSRVPRSADGSAPARTGPSAAAAADEGAPGQPPPQPAAPSRSTRTERQLSTIARIDAAIEAAMGVDDDLARSVVGMDDEEAGLLIGAYIGLGADGGGGGSSSSTGTAGGSGSRHSTRSRAASSQAPGGLAAGSVPMPSARSRSARGSRLPASLTTSSFATLFGPQMSDDESGGGGGGGVAAGGASAPRGDASGSRPSQAIVVDDLPGTSSAAAAAGDDDGGDDDDDFTVVGARRRPLERHHMLDRLIMERQERDLARRQLQARERDDFFDSTLIAFFDRIAAEPEAGPSSGSAAPPRGEPTMTRSTTSHNLRIGEGIPAPSRYRHRDRTVQYLQGRSMAEMLAMHDDGRPPPRLAAEAALRHFDILPRPRSHYLHGESRKLPERFDAGWTHPAAAPEGTSHSIIEPPIEVDADPFAAPTGPLPDTTPICARCRYALQMGGTGDRKVWALPCGHVVDGRCVREMSDPTHGAAAGAGRGGPARAALQNGESLANGKARAYSREPEAESDRNPLKRTVSERERGTGEDAVVGKGARHGKGKAVELEDDDDEDTTEDEAPALEPATKRRHVEADSERGIGAARSSSSSSTTRGTEANPIDADISSQSFEIVLMRRNPDAVGSRTGKGKASTAGRAEEDDEPVVSGVKLQPVHFRCPVAGCGQLCFPKGEHDLSVVELFL